jgi:hypothetical protein
MISLLTATSSRIILTIFAVRLKLLGIIPFRDVTVHVLITYQEEICDFLFLLKTTIPRSQAFVCWRWTFRSAVIRTRHWRLLCIWTYMRYVCMSRSIRRRTSFIWRFSVPSISSWGIVKGLHLDYIIATIILGVPLIGLVILFWHHIILILIFLIVLIYLFEVRLGVMQPVNPVCLLLLSIGWLVKWRTSISLVRSPSFPCMDSNIIVNFKKRAIERKNILLLDTFSA